MKAIVIVPGEKDGTLELRDVPEPKLRPGQLLIRVKATGLNAGTREGTLTAVDLVNHGSAGAGFSAGVSGPFLSIYDCANVHIADVRAEMLRSAAQKQIFSPPSQALPGTAVVRRLRLIPSPGRAWGRARVPFLLEGLASALWTTRNDTQPHVLSFHVQGCAAGE